MAPDPSPTRARVRLFLAALLARIRAHGIGVTFVVVASLAAHHRLSWIGFNPTDDGFVLAYTRRVLRGEIPHRDFISIRPVGSALFHAPFVLFGGRFTFLVDRWFVWFELATIAWLWTVLLVRASRARTTALQRVAIAAAGFMLSAHTFPIMAWHTIDALFAASLGVAACERRRTRWLGYALLGLAALCKQNFAVLAPLVLLTRGDHRELRAWLAVASLPLLYVGWITWNQGLLDLVQQLTAQSELWPSGWKSFVTRPTMGWRFALGILLGVAAFGARSEALVARRRGVLLAVIGLWFAVEAATVFDKHEDYYSHAFELFAVVAGVVAGSLFSEDDEHWRAGVVALAAAWCTTISMGYVSPALASAPLVALILAAGLRGLAHESVGAPIGPRWSSIALAAVGVLTIARVDVARHLVVYRDKPAMQLTYRVDDVIGGTKGIRTSLAMREYLDDLKLALSKAGPGEVGIVPDFAAYYVASGVREPLGSAWPLNVELATPALIHRMLQQTELQRGRTTLIVEKFAAHSVPIGGNEWIGESYSVVVSEVRSHWKLVDSTKNFDVYR